MRTHDLRLVAFHDMASTAYIKKIVYRVVDISKYFSAFTEWPWILIALEPVSPFERQFKSSLDIFQLGISIMESAAKYLYKKSSKLFNCHLEQSLNIKLETISFTSEFFKVKTMRTIGNIDYGDIYCSLRPSTKVVRDVEHWRTFLNTKT